ncbi:helix-turn-helix domain-containing protein [Sphingomonas sp.]|uniref:helix-turn-helix domain-containing protein n=1 Tax=Sphingomonas sp. TaxID=28214 RepID=UPI003CC66BB9
MPVKVRAISIEGDADPVTLALIRQVLAAAPGKVDLFVQAAHPSVRPTPVRLIGDDGVKLLAPAPLPCPPVGIVGDLAKLAACHVGLTVRELLGAGRAAHLVCARSAVALVAREQGLSVPQIGRALGGRDHTTIVHALRRAATLTAADPAFRLLCDRLRAGIEEKN